MGTAKAVLKINARNIERAQRFVEDGKTLEIKDTLELEFENVEVGFVPALMRWFRHEATPVDLSLLRERLATCGKDHLIT